jgi:alanyl-tRNA synthetase
MKTAARIRQEFLDFFAHRHGHAVVPSSPVVPLNDPTLLFTNAGMNQFKDVFLGQGTRPYTRAVDTQKCIRAGGKHNDLEDVGKDTYHHTFFEMLGNWSFGDYFKDEAIAWAWELLTKVYGLDSERLHATYFQGDAAEKLEPDREARELWKRFLPEDRIHPGNKKDNFWEMGDTGPCGPCSEIHYDATPDKHGGALVNAGDPRVIEIWNLVFIQFNRGSDGKLVPLPAKHVDTGMGFERLVRVLQGKDSNYDTDIFAPLFVAIESHTRAHPYRGRLDDPVDIAYRVLADHVRCLTMAITDGAIPSNEGRGYVLRRILRRAVRHAHQTLGVRGPVIHHLVPAVIQTLGDVFPELKREKDRVAHVIHDEEAAFLRTLERGIEHFEKAAGRAVADGSRRISAEDAFKLHDTYGFPIDLTRVMAEEKGLAVDEAGFEHLMEQAREKSRGKHGGHGAHGGADSADDIDFTLPPHALARLKHMGIAPTDDIDKFHGRPITATIRAIWNGRDFDHDVHGSGSKRVALILDRTAFYAEQGGQVGDVGAIYGAQDTGQVGGWGHEHRLPKGAARFDVAQTMRCGDYILHVGALKEGALHVGDAVTADVADIHRNPVRANHTGTHLLNHALRQVLSGGGDDVNQKGSLVAPDRLRFDFSFSRALTAEEINAVERLVNAAIHQNMPVHARDVPLATAMKINGVRAVFGEKYPDPVRVVSIGPSIDRLIAQPDLERWRECSIEFCGGTHLATTNEAKRFVIASEQALAAGVRRIVALTGAAALAADAAGKELEARVFRAKSLDGDAFVEEAADIRRQIDELSIGAVARQKLVREADELQDRARKLRKESQARSRDSVIDQARVLAENVNGRIIVDALLGADGDALMAAADVMKAKRPDAASMLFSANEIESKVFIVAHVPRELIAKGLKAGDWVREAAKVCGGGGGGRPDLAQAGGKDPAKLDDAIRRAKSFAEETLK